MDQLFFTISFVYEILPGSLQVDLCADIEMTGTDTCIVRNIQRINVNESPLLPVIKLINRGGRLIHSEGTKDSNISRVVGESIDKYMGQLSKSPDKMKDN